MKKREVKEIIKNYEPIKGFDDLREYILPAEDFARFYNIQVFLAQCEAARRRGAYAFNKAEFDRVKELSAQYQQALFSYPLKPKAPEGSKEQLVQ